MGQWKHEIEFKDLSEAFLEDRISFEDLRAKWVERIKNHPLLNEFQTMNDFALSFEETIDDEDFDILMNDFYDFADEIKMWVK